MRTLMRSGILAVALWGAFPSDALAVLGWLEKLSGPGDFRGPEFLIPIACYGEDRRTVGTTSSSDDSDSKRTLFVDWDCRLWARQDRFRAILAVDVAGLSTSGNPIDYGAGTAPSVDLFWVIPTVMVPLHPTFRVGAGFGFGRFSGDDDVFNPFWRSFYQPLRVSVAPLRLFGKSRRLEFLQLHGGLMVILGKISASDFGGGGDFRESNEVVPNGEIAIDLLALMNR